jgi:PAS domain-containing protein
VGGRSQVETAGERLHFIPSAAWAAAQRGGCLLSQREQIPSSAVVPPDCDVRIGRLLEYWRAIAPVAGRLPGRQHLEPTDLPELLRWIWLIDVQPEPLRFRYRLVGTGHREVIGRDVTGMPVDEVMPDFPRMPGYADFIAAAGGEMRFCRRPPPFAVDKSFVLMERLALPLARDGTTVDMLLGLTLYMRADGTLVP